MKYPNLAKVYQLDALVERIRRTGGSKADFREQALDHLLRKYNFVRSTAEDVVERAWSAAGPCDPGH